VGGAGNVPTQSYVAHRRLQIAKFTLGDVAIEYAAGTGHVVEPIARAFASIDATRPHRFR